MKYDTAVKNVPYKDSTSIAATVGTYHLNDSLKLVQKADSSFESSVFSWAKWKKHTAVQEPQQQYVHSVFEQHVLKARDTEQQKPPYGNNVFYSLILGFILLVLAVARQANNKRFREMISAFFVPRIASQVQREENSAFNRTSFTLGALFVFSGGLFLFQLASFFGVYPLLAWGNAAYLIFCAAIFLVYTVKIASLRVLAYVFRTEALFSEYVFLIVLFNQVLGLALIPVTACIAFVHVADAAYFVFTGIALVAGIFIYRLLRAIIGVFSRPNVSGFYLFLYLCTLEFLPMAILVKSFMLVFNK